MSNITVGQKLAEFEIIKGGVATTDGQFEAWGTDELVGKATYLVANAGHSEANDMHQALSTKIQEANNIRMCRIINAKDAPMGAGMFIKGEFKKGAKTDPSNVYVMDTKGVIAKEFDMAKKSAVTVVINAEGTVVFAHEGIIGSEEEARVMEAIASVE